MMVFAAGAHGVRGSEAAGSSTTDYDHQLLPDLQSHQINNLVLFGQVWGFLKYHHPNFTQGCVSWDDEIVVKLPMILEIGNQRQGKVQLETWIRELKPDTSCENPVSEDIHLHPGTGWVDDHDMLGPELSESLRSLQVTGASSELQYYVSQQSGVGNPVFENEREYAELGHPDWRYRLLALYRFWNIVEYWFPYRDLIEDDWNQVLAEFVVPFYLAKETDDYILELMALIARIDDGHANLWSSIRAQPPTGPANIPFMVRFVEGRALVWKEIPLKQNQGSAPDAAMVQSELKVGDLILSIDGQPVEELLQLWSPYYGASNNPARLRRIGTNLLRGDEGPIGLTISHDGEVLDVTARRVSLNSMDLTAGYRNDRNGETYQQLSDEIAYIKLSSIDQQNTAGHVTAAKDTEGLIIDIRGYPSSFVVFALGQHLVSEPTPFARFTRGDLTSPGAFSWGPSVAIQPAEPRYEGRVVILVDEYTQSQAEYTAMAFRASPNAIVVGSQTAGADGNVSRIPLPGGHRTAISGIGVFYPDKTPTQQVGIVPEREVRPTIAGIRAGRDEVLEAAIREILGPDVPNDVILTMSRRTVPMSESETN